MKITNRAGLPEAFVLACETGRHNRAGEISATTLLKGAKEIVLSDRHWEDLEEDCSDRVWQVFGSAVHKVLEVETPDSFVEESFSVAVGGKTVTGRVDCYEPNAATLSDYKTASVWKVQFRDFGDWRRQGLIYAWLLRQATFEVRKCRFIALLKDHSKSKARFDREYPQSPVYVYEFDVTDRDLAGIEAYIRAKVAEVEEAERLSDDEIAPCSEAERWARPGKFALMKKGRKSALKLYDTREEAESSLAEGCYIEERRGTDGKCSGYCSCREFCNYWKENYKE